MVLSQLRTHTEQEGQRHQCWTGAGELFGFTRTSGRLHRAMHRRRMERLGPPLLRPGNQAEPQRPRDAMTPRPSPVSLPPEAM